MESLRFIPSFADGIPPYFPNGGPRVRTSYGASFAISLYDIFLLSFFLLNDADADADADDVVTSDDRRRFFRAAARTPVTDADDAKLVVLAVLDARFSTRAVTIHRNVVVVVVHTRRRTNERTDKRTASRTPGGWFDTIPDGHAIGNRIDCSRERRALLNDPFERPTLVYFVESQLVMGTHTHTHTQ